MPDVPDYSKYLPGSTRFALTDLGDLAVRLGSPVYYDRRGEVVYYDTFKYGLSGWTQIKSGNGSNIAIIPSSRMYSGFCARLTSGTTLDKSASLIHTESCIGSKRYGIELCLGDRTGGGTLEVNLIGNMIGGGFRIGFRYDFDTYKQSIRINDTSYVEVLPSVTIGSSYDNVSHIKIVADFNTGKYIRLMIKNVTIDISDYIMQSVEDEGLDEVSIQIIRNGNNLGVRTTDINHVILTANEP